MKPVVKVNPPRLTLLGWVVDIRSEHYADMVDFSGLLFEWRIRRKVKKLERREARFIGKEELLRHERAFFDG